jgi:hypothetical protein
LIQGAVNPRQFNQTNLVIDPNAPHYFNPQNAGTATNA